MSILDKLMGRAARKPGGGKFNKRTCWICGKKVPRGRHDTCSYGCKVVKDKRYKEATIRIHRRRMRLQLVEKGGSRASQGLDLLFKEGQ